MKRYQKFFESTIRNGFFAENDFFKFWNENGEVYRVSKRTPIVMGTDGKPLGLRWEAKLDLFLKMNDKNPNWKARLY